MVRALFSPGNLILPYSVIVDDVFHRMVDTYKRMFNAKPPFCPAIPDGKKRVAFPERNLTFNFCNEYLREADKNNGDEIFVWQELDVVNSTRGHIDSVIIDTRTEVHAILFIEAKRIANGGCKVNGKKVSKMEGLKNDMDRLRHLDLPGFSTLSPKWNVSDDIKKLINSHTEIYIMALVDYWEWNGRKNTNAAMESADFEICAGRPFESIGSVTSPKKGDYCLNYCLENLKTQLGKCCSAM